jgi:hypothetical protein
MLFLTKTIWHGLSWIRQASALLAFVCVIITWTCFLFCQSWAGFIKAVAEVCPVLDAKDILIENYSECVQSRDHAELNRFINRRLHFPSEHSTHISISGVKIHSIPSGSFDGIIWNRKVHCYRQGIRTRQKNCNDDKINCRRLLGIMNTYFQFGILVLCTINDTSRAHFGRNISTQLLVFHFRGDDDLIFGRLGLPFRFLISITCDHSSRDCYSEGKKRKNNTYQSEPALASPIFALGSFMVFFIGIPIFVFGYIRYSWWLTFPGIIMIVFGGGTFWRILSPHAAAGHVRWRLSLQVRLLRLPLSQVLYLC